MIIRALAIIAACAVLSSCKSIRQPAPTLERIYIRDTVVKIEGQVIKDTLWKELIYWDTLTEVISLPLPPPAVIERDGLRAEARLTPSGLILEASRADTAVTLQTTEHFRTVIEPTDCRQSWSDRLILLVAGFLLGLLYSVIITKLFGR